MIFKSLGVIVPFYFALARLHFNYYAKTWALFYEGYIQTGTDCSE